MQVSSHFNVDDALSSILGDGFEPIPLPDNTADISRVLGKGEDLYKNLVNTAMKLRGGKDMEKGQLEKVALWLYALHTVEQLVRINDFFYNCLRVVSNSDRRI